MSFSLPLSIALQLRRRHIWSCIKAPDVKRSSIAQLCAECGIILVVDVIRKIVYNITLWLLHQMSIVQFKAVQLGLIELQLWESSYHFLSCATWFRFQFNIKHLIVKSKVYSHCNFIGTAQYFFHLAECSQSILNTSSPSTFQIALCFYFSPSLCPTPTLSTHVFLIYTQSDHTGCFLQLGDFVVSVSVLTFPLKPTAGQAVWRTAGGAGPCWRWLPVKQLGPCSAPAQAALR